MLLLQFVCIIKIFEKRGGESKLIFNSTENEISRVQIMVKTFVTTFSTKVGFDTKLYFIWVAVHSDSSISRELFGLLYKPVLK